MRPRPRPTRPSLLALSLGLLASSSPPHLSVQTSHIAGMWRFNAEQSDNLEDKLREEARQGGVRGGYPGGGPRSGPRGGGGRGGRPADGGDRGGGGLGGAERVMGSVAPILQLLIRQNDSSVEISDAAGQMQLFRTDGKKVKEELLNGERLETTARWNGGKLTIERNIGKSGSLKETYFIDPVSSKLILQLKFDGSRMPRALELRRVYDRATDQ